MCKEAMSTPNIILHNKIVCYTCYEFANLLVLILCNSSNS